VAAIPSLEREHERLLAEEIAAQELCMASLKELGYQDGDETPEAFLERISETVTSTLSSLEALLAPAQAPQAQAFPAPKAQAPQSHTMFPAFGMAPPPGTR